MQIATALVADLMVYVMMGLYSYQQHPWSSPNGNMYHITPQSCDTYTAHVEGTVSAWRSQSILYLNRGMAWLAEVRDLSFPLGSTHRTSSPLQSSFDVAPVFSGTCLGSTQAGQLQAITVAHTSRQYIAQWQIQDLEKGGQ